MYHALSQVNQLSDTCQFRIGSASSSLIDPIFWKIMDLRRTVTIDKQRYRAFISLGWETGHEKAELSEWKNYFANVLSPKLFFFVALAFGCR